jgi:hypothetical protein
VTLYHDAAEWHRYVQLTERMLSGITSEAVQSRIAEIIGGFPAEAAS